MQSLVVRFLCVIVAVVTSLTALNAQAGTATSNLAVSMQINASCTINAASLIFAATAGTALIASNVNASATVSVTCTSGSPYSIGMDNGANASGNQRRMKNGANFLNYGLYVNPPPNNPWITTGSPVGCTPAGSCFLGTGSGSPQSVTINGRVPSIGTAPPTGTYTDTVTMTITY